MKLFTEEINKPLKYKVEATVKVNIEVIAHSEGDAGYDADKELGTIDGYVSHEIDNIEVINE